MERESLVRKPGMIHTAHLLFVTEITIRRFCTEPKILSPLTPHLKGKSLIHSYLMAKGENVFSEVKWVPEVFQV